MPTIIDSLVVQLGLDPKNFTQGQKSAVASLQQLQQQAQRTSTNIQRSGTGIITFFNNAQHPVNALHQAFARLAVSTATNAPLQTNLNRTAAQGRVAGAGIQAGALAGASGMRILGAAGLAAFATYTLVNKVLSEAKENASNVFRTGVGAATSGTNVRQFSAISQALRVAGNVPEAVTQGWMAELKTWQENYKAYGADPQRATALTQASRGTIRPISDTSEDMLKKLAVAFAGMTETRAVSEGSRVGIDREFALVLRKVGRDLEALAAKERERSTTGEQVVTAEDTLRATNSLSIALNNLSRIMWAELTPGIVRLAEIIETVVNWLGKKTNLDTVRDAITRSVPGAGPVYAIKKAYDWLTGKKEGAAPGTTSSATSEPGAASGYSSPATAIAGRIISQNESQDRDVNNYMYDRPGARRMGSDGVEVGHTAGGYHQMLDTNWVKYAKQLGIDTTKYPRAKGTPKPIQEAVFSAMFNKEGFTPWSSAAGGPMTSAKIAAAKAAMAKGSTAAAEQREMSDYTNKSLRELRPRAQAAPNSNDAAYNAAYPGADKAGRQTTPAFNDPKYGFKTQKELDAFENGLKAIREGGAEFHKDNPLPGKRSDIDYIRRHNASGQAARVANNTSNSSAVNTGDVNVYTQATDAQGTGGAVSNAIKRLVTESNAGLSG